MKIQKTIRYDQKTIQNLRNRIERRSVVIESLNEETAVLREQNRNDYALIKKLHQMV